MPATVETHRGRPTGIGPAARQPRLRIRPAPPLEPPFDDEHERPPAGMEMLPFPVVRSSAITGVGAGRRPTPARPTGRSGATKGREAAAVREQEGGCFGPTAARRFIRLCLEVINGYRPVTHLRPLVPPQRFASVTDQILRRTVRLRMSSGSRLPVQLRRVRLCQPSLAAIEAAVILGHGDRCWAMAVRLEHSPDGWQCVTVQVI